MLLEMLVSLRATEPDVEVLLVDDGSPAPELVDEIEATKSQFQFELHRKDVNSGFSSTVNIGLRRALSEGKDAVLVNADIEFMDPGWLAPLTRQQRSDATGPAEVVGALLLYPNDLIQHAGIFFSLLDRSFGHIFQFAPGNLHEAQFARRCPVTGAFQFIRHSTLASVGIYDEEFTMGFEDVDYCIRVFLAGGECVMQPLIRAHHHESLFRGRQNPKIVQWQNQSWGHFMTKYRSQSFSEWVPSLV